MKGFSNECGSRNAFGYFDCFAGEIVLKRPCTRKQDIQEAYFWIETCSNLKKFSLGVGSVETFLANGTANSLYKTARGILKNSIIKNKYSDAEMLRNVILRLMKHKELRNLGLKCFMFSDDQLLFERLLELIHNLPDLAYLDLTGCYFSDEQLIDLAKVIAKTKIAHLIWPEPRLSKSLLDEILNALKLNKSLVVIANAPVDVLKLAKRNREDLFSLGKYPSMMDDEDIAIIKAFRNSVIVAFAYEKEKLAEMEKTFMAVLAEYPDYPDKNLNNCA